MQPDDQTAYWNKVAQQKTFTHPLDLIRLKRLLGKESHLLDFGCGYGRLVAQLMAAGFRNVVGYDTSEQMILRGRQAGNRPLYHIAHPAALPIANHSMDGILLFAVLTCIPSDAGQTALVELLFHKLKPGGLLYLSDYYLQADRTETGGYRTGSDGGYGLFTLPGGATFRHHTREWIRQLTQHFRLYEEYLVPVRTMNGHQAEAFQLFLQKL